jgi:hypothetical protein
MALVIMVGLFLPGDVFHKLMALERAIQAMPKGKQGLKTHFLRSWRFQFTNKTSMAVAGLWDPEVYFNKSCDIFFFGEFSSSRSPISGVKPRSGYTWGLKFYGQQGELG